MCYVRGFERVIQMMPSNFPWDHKHHIEQSKWRVYIWFAGLVSCHWHYQEQEWQLGLENKSSSWSYSISFARQSWILPEDLAAYCRVSWSIAWCWRVGCKILASSLICARQALLSLETLKKLPFQSMQVWSGFKKIDVVWLLSHRFKLLLGPDYLHGIFTFIISM